MKKILITDDVHPLLTEGLSQLGYECDCRPTITLEETTNLVSAYHGIIINSKIKANRFFLDKAENLRFIGRLGSGLEIIDLEAARKNGVLVLSAPEGNANAVAEHAMGMLLCLINKIHLADEEVRRFEWNREKNRGVELQGKKVGIIGYGHTGSAFAAKLSGFGVEILVYDRFLEQIKFPDQTFSQCNLEEIQADADVISLHVSLNPTSKHLVDARFIDRCKKSFYLINTSRGNVVKTEDLLQGLDDGKVIGAGLDVFENEKTETFTAKEKQMYSVLYQRKDVLLTPHIAGWTIESKRKISEVLLQKITALKN